MTKSVIPESPPILEIDIDIGRGKRQLYQAIYQLGMHFTWNPLRIRRAVTAALQAYRQHRERMINEKLTLSQAIGENNGVKAPTKSSQSTIALIGHPYLLYDDYVNHRLIHRLEQAGNRVVTSEMLSPGELESATTRLVGKAYWTYEEEIVGAGGHYLQDKVDGIIGIMAFGCGPDSLMVEMVRRQAIRLKSVPFMSLTLEEHTAEAGIVTRLEAFTDMIQRRKRGQ